MGDSWLLGWLVGSTGVPPKSEEKKDKENDGFRLISLFFLSLT